MENKILNKLISSIKWYDKDLQRVISSAKSACMILHQRGVSYKDFFMAAMEENPYITQILLKHAYKVGWMEEHTYDDCKTMIFCECIKTMECFSEEKYYGPDSYENYEEKFLVYTATALLFSDSYLLEKTFKCVQRLLENKEQGLLFSQKMFNILHYAGTNTEYCALFYQQLYCHLPIDWCEHIAYNQGIEIPVMEKMPSALKDLLYKALQNQHMRYIDLVLKVFVNVHLHQMNILPEELVQISMQVYNKNIFRGLLLTEKLIATDSSSSIEALEKWWLLLNKFQNNENPFWVERKYWFHTYYLSRQIYYDPNGAKRYIEQMPVILPSDFKVRKINEVIQNAMETLFMAKEKLVFEYMEKLGDNNAFRFNTDEEYYPRFENNSSFNLEDAINNLLALGYKRTELIDIYMNSFLRSSYPIVFFMRTVFDDTENLAINGDYADIRVYFQKYKMAAYVKKTETGLGLLLHNVFNNQKYIYFASDWWQKHNSYCQQMLSDNQKVYCYLTTWNLNNLCPQAELCLEEEEKTLAQDFFADNFKRFLKCLEEIVEKKELTTEMNGEIVRLNFPLPLSDENFKKMHLLFLDCIVALSENLQSPKYLIKMINVMVAGRLNIYKYRLGQKLPKSLTGDMIVKIRAYWQKFSDMGITLEDTFFVYINTIFKQCISFSELLLPYHDANSPIMDLSKLLSEHTNYCFAGKVISVSEDMRYQTPVYYINIQPYDFYSGEPGHYDSFCYRTERYPRYEKGQLCFFRIEAYNSRTNTFFIKELMEQHELHKAVPVSLFKNAMAKVAVQKEITPQILSDLNINLPPLGERDVDSLITSMMGALEYRSNDIAEIDRYLEMIEKNNPWRFDAGPIYTNYCHNGPDNEYIRVRIKKLFDKLVQQYDLRSVLYVYFNSLLKIFIPLNTLLMAYSGKGIYTDSLDIWMKEYPLLVSGGVEYLQAVNFIGNNIVVISQAVDSPLFLKEYRTEEDILILETDPDERESRVLVH